MTDPVVSAARSVPALRARGVSKALSRVPALLDFDLDIEPGQVHALVGGNGSGKSTFIKILSGFHKPDAGKVEIGGEVLHAGARMLPRPWVAVSSTRISDSSTR